MKRLLIILFLCFAGNSYICKAQFPWGKDMSMDLEKIKEYLNAVPGSMFEEPAAGFQLSSHAKCFYLMILYSIEYNKQIDRIDNATDCQEKYDLYGILLIHIASSTAISYCPEDLLDLFNNPKRKNEKERFIEELTFIWQIGRFYSNSYDGGGLFFYTDWNRLSLDIYGKIYEYLYHITVNKFLIYGTHISDSEVYESAIKQIIHDYFHPDTIISTTFVVGEKMDALPCSPGSKHRKN